MKKILIVFYCTSFLLLSSCSMLVKTLVTSSPALNKIPLHENPRIGDYAVTKDIESNIITRFEVIDVESDTVTIHITNKVLKLETITDKAGTVLAAYYLDGNNKTRLQIATPGDDGYITETKLSTEDLESLLIPTNVDTVTGTFQCSIKYYAFSVKERKAYMVFYINEKVPFLKVAETSLTEDNGIFSRGPIFKLIDYGFGD